MARAFDYHRTAIAHELLSAPSKLLSPHHAAYLRESRAISAWLSPRCGPEEFVFWFDLWDELDTYFG